jgi:hypothetical protein
MSSSRHFDSLADFYADRARWRSTERDFGLGWRGPDGETYRAAWIQDTEELYAVRHGERAGGGGRVEVLGWLSAGAVERELCGWADKCGQLGSFRWLRERASQQPSRRRRRKGRAGHGAPPPWAPRSATQAREALGWLAPGPPPSLGR